MTSDTANAPTAPAPPANPPPTPPPPPPSPPTPAAQPPAPHSPSPLRRIVRWSLWCAAGVAAIVLVDAFGIPWLSYRLSHSITEDAFVEAHIVNVAPEMVSGRIVR